LGELKEDLAAMAREELERALTLSWRDLAAVAPWGDAFDGFTPAGRQVTVERSYLWADAVGGDILCEVEVYGGPSRWDEGVRRGALICRPAARGRPGGAGERMDDGETAS
jgi:hypothetical protein